MLTPRNLESICHHILDLLYPCCPPSTRFFSGSQKSVVCISNSFVHLFPFCFVSHPLEQSSWFLLWPTRGRANYACICQALGGELSDAKGFLGNTVALHSPFGAGSLVLLVASVPLERGGVALVSSFSLWIWNATTFSCLSKEAHKAEGPTEMGSLQGPLWKCGEERGGGFRCSCSPSYPWLPIAGQVQGLCHGLSAPREEWRFES